jgi:hypothetical protein
MRHYILLLSLAVISCQSPSTFSKEEKQAVRDSVHAVLSRYYEDINRNGLIAEFNYLDSSADFHWLPPGATEPIYYDSVAKFIRASAPFYKYIDIKWSRLEITPISPDTASYEGELVSAITDTTGKISNTILIEKGRVVKRRDGWKLLDGETKPR